MTASLFTVRIKDIGRVVTGTTPPTKVDKYYGNDFLFIKPSDITPALRRVFASETMLSIEGHDYLRGKALPCNTTCVVCIGTIGKLCLTSMVSFTNQQINAVIPDTIRYEPLYVFYLLCTIIPQLQKLQGGSASGREHVNKSNFENILVNVHPLAAQRKIASILSAYDDLIENNTRRIAILEAMAQANYREWFVEFRFPGHEKVKFVNSPLGKIPMGWKPTRLGDLAEDVRRGVDPSHVDPETPYFGLEHLPRKSITLSEWGWAKDVQSTKLAFRQGEILFGKIRPYFHKVGVAPVDGVCSSDAIVIAPKTKEVFGPVLCCVSSDAFVSHATQTSQGTKMPRANWSVLVKYPLPMPQGPLLEQFNELISDIVRLLRNVLLKNRNLRRTRDLLLPKLISGQLDVEDLDIEIAHE